MAESEQYASVRDIDVSEVWDRLSRDAGCHLIDVRTRAEWAFVGVPDLSAIGRDVLFVEWQQFPDGSLNPSFVSALSSELAALAASSDAALFFICRSGGRSRTAAAATAGEGYRVCLNVAGGFEGPLDQIRHRGAIAGWKAAGLPWRQG